MPGGKGFGIIAYQGRSQDLKKGFCKACALARSEIFKATPTNKPNRAFYACAYCAVPNIRYSNIAKTIAAIVDVCVRS